MRTAITANLSWNCGVEGPTADPGINELRRRQMMNLLCTLFLSQGVPMLQAGDEFARTQQGNNNAYCQDNEISWIDWRLRERNRDLTEFVRLLAELRRTHEEFRRETFLKGTVARVGVKDVTWLNARGSEMAPEDWNNPALRTLGIWFGRRSRFGGTLSAAAERGRRRAGVRVAENSGQLGVPLRHGAGRGAAGEADSPRGAGHLPARPEQRRTSGELTVNATLIERLARLSRGG